MDYLKDQVQKKLLERFDQGIIRDLPPIKEGADFYSNDYLGHAHLESTQNYIHYDTKKLFKEQVHGFNREEL